MSLNNSFETLIIDPAFRPLLSPDKKIIYFFGIIDIMTKYDFRKKMENLFKTTFIGKAVSCRPPRVYAKRFLDFMKKEVFVKC